MKQTIITILLAIVAALGGGYTATNFGNISENESMNATTTSYVWPTNYPRGVQIRTGAGVLGSVIIGNATAVGTLTLYDATTTAHGAYHPTTTIATINTGTPGGAIPVNVSFTRGLLAVSSATLATTTITSK